MKAKGPDETQVNALTGFSQQIMSEFEIFISIQLFTYNSTQRRMHYSLVLLSSLLFAFIHWQKIIWFQYQ